MNCRRRYKEITVMYESEILVCSVNELNEVLVQNVMQR